MAPSRPTGELSDVLRASRGYLLVATGFSLAINLLYLASPIYMLQVYNRVVTSGSQVTLVMLSIILLAAFAALSVLDLARARILNRFGVRLENLLAARVMSASFMQTDATGPRGQALRDFETCRQFVSSGSIAPLLDLPWVPIYITAAFLLHPAIGLFTLVCSILLLVLAVSNEIILSAPMREANAAAATSNSFAEMSLRNAEVVRAMGMTESATTRWRRDRDRFISSQSRASDRSAGVGGLIRFLRLSMQSLILGLGALLAVERVVSVGAMFASTFLLGRALQPIEQLVGSWRNLVAARSAYRRITDFLAAYPAPPAVIDLPPPKGHLEAEAVHVALPGANKFILRNVSLQLLSGEALGVIGPSGAGKSTLVRTLVGVLKPSAGVVRIDGADMQSWSRTRLGCFVGYLPQDIELFADTVAANISRFNADADADVVKAAQMAGVHEMILKLPRGYNTQVGEGGTVLSGGYRQRIGLARAVFRIPSLVVLDEPSSNLDAEGDAALAACMRTLKSLGSTLVVVSHRPVTLGAVDKILYLKEGLVEAFGSKDEVLAKFGANATSPVPPPPSVPNG